MQIHAFKTNRTLKPGEVAKLLNITAGHLRHIAKNEKIPGLRKTRGGQLRWQNCAALRNYIANRLAAKARSQKRTQYRQPRNDTVRNRLPVDMRISQSELIAFARWARSTGRKLTDLTPETLSRIRSDLEPAIQLAKDIDELTAKPSLSLISPQVPL